MKALRPGQSRPPRRPGTHGRGSPRELGLRWSPSWAGQTVGRVRARAMSGPMDRIPLTAPTWCADVYVGVGCDRQSAASPGGLSARAPTRKHAERRRTLLDFVSAPDLPIGSAHGEGRFDPATSISDDTGRSSGAPDRSPGDAPHAEYVRSECCLLQPLTRASLPTRAPSRPSKTLRLSGTGRGTRTPGSHWTGSWVSLEAAPVTGGRARRGGLSGRGLMPHSTRSSAVRGWCVVKDGEVAAIDPRDACQRRGCRWRTGGGDRSSITADDAGRPGGRCHSHQLGAQVRRPEDVRRWLRGHTEQRVDRRLRPRRRERRAGRDQRPGLALSTMMRVGEV